MLVGAFRYAAGWQALTPVASSLGAVVLTLWVTRRGERERAQAAAEERAADREHERALRNLELRDARQARLHDHRIAAYRRVRIRLLERHTLTQEAVGLREQTREYGVTRESGAEIEAALKAIRLASKAVEKALVSVHLVASRPVQEAVANLEGALARDEQESAGRFNIDLFLDDRSEEGRARAEVAWYERWTEAAIQARDAEKHLRDAISKELALDE